MKSRRTVSSKILAKDSVPPIPKKHALVLSKVIRRAVCKSRTSLQAASVKVYRFHYYD